MKLIARDIEDETHSQLGTEAKRVGGARLVALWEGGTASVPLPASGRILIGRSARCDLRIVHGSASREHAVVHVEGGLFIEDLGSSNGTKVNGRELEPGVRASVARSTLVELGSTVLQVQEGLAHLEVEDLLPAPQTDVQSMAQTQRVAQLVAGGDISVILRGETGVGKEVLAKAIHDQSPRADKPYLKLNCAAFAESMVESELFGHERGAFTGAHQAKPGLLEAANGGTVLLDEVGELPLLMQAKLLRALGNREIIRVGATRPRPVDVRILAATHRDLEALIEAGEFRADLYFRLNGITLEVPALRNRREEILPLAKLFLKEHAEKLAIVPPRLPVETERHLLAYSWPGNIRELRSVLERAILLAEGGTIYPRHCVLSSRSVSSPESAPPPSRPEADRPPAGTPLPSAVSGSGKQLKDEMRELEKRRITDAMAQCGGNQTKAARVLGMSRRALLHRLDAYGLPRPRKTT